MKNYWFLLLLIGGLFTACNEDDMTHEDDHMHTEDDYDATIAIMSPAADAMVTVDESAHVHIDFTRPDSKIIHNVKVEVLDADGNVVKTLLDDHVHEASPYTFESDDFTPEAHGAYTLRATTSTDDGDQTVMEERAFTAMHGGHSGGDYKVTIDIVSPAENAIMAAGAAMDVEVNYTNDAHGEIIHNVRIDVIDESDEVVAVIYEEHVHTDQPYNYKKADAVAPDKAGTYRLRAMTTDMAMENMNMMMRAFTVQ